ncbi:MAG: 2-hydroxyacyl-CoA dehydratase family protein [Myxococcota bacterium]|jgi:benzoyl-CoA reductase/2-hydroxyglutaryl-CoA dehydratase subunit BcrC/BadD/HgdB|nr:2-hydroxyacyl-CoA dehydratase family protein [Myxococcota bacterium]
MSATLAELLSRLEQRSRLELNAHARLAHAHSRPAVGVLCAFAPPELIHAAGAQPIRILSHGYQRAELGNPYFAATHCSLVRRVFDMATSGYLADFDGIVLSTGCDHSRRVYDAWRHAECTPRAVHLLHVSSDSSATAVAALEAELERLSVFLRELTGHKFGDSELSRSIAIFDRQRTLFEAVYRHCARLDSPLSGQQMLQLSLVMSSIPVEESVSILEALLEALSGATAQPQSEARRELRFFLASGHFEQVERMALIERHAGRVVQELMCTGAGQHLGRVDTTLPPMRALASRSLRRLSCPHAADELDRRFAFILEGVQAGRCDGVILDRLSFCAIWAAEAFVFRRRLRARGIPVLELEGELGSLGEGQLRTRLEAFAESIRNATSTT